MPVAETRLECTCGNQFVVEGDGERVTCSCGAAYVVTVTELRPPDEP